MYVCFYTDRLYALSWNKAGKEDEGQYETSLLVTQENLNASGYRRRAMEDSGTQSEIYMQLESSRISSHRAVESSEQREERL